MFSEASMHRFQPNFSFSAFEIGHLFSHNINYNINSLFQLHVGARIRCRRVLHSGSRNENIIGKMEKVPNHLLCFCFNIIANMQPNNE